MIADRVRLVDVGCGDGEWWAGTVVMGNRVEMLCVGTSLLNG